MKPGADVINAAIRYAAAGVFVFPLRVRIMQGRKSVAPISHWDQESTTDRRTVTGWFNPRCGAWRDGSLGIDCGKSGVVVVDPDGTEGVANWDTFVLKHHLGATWRCSTPGGGQHWYFRADPAVSLGNSAGRLAGHVDVRGAGGFVIAPPSVDSRGAYRWLEGEPDWRQLPVVPGVVVERLAAPVVRPVAPSGHTSPGGRRRFTREQAVAFCTPHVEALRTAPDGQINHRLNNAAKVLSHFVPAFWSADQARRALHNALLCTDYDGATWQADNTIDSAFRSAATDWSAEVWLQRAHPKAG